MKINILNGASYELSLEDEGEEEKERSDLMRKATENNKFWSSLVSIKGIRKVRLAHLQDIMTNGDEESVVLYGRTIPKRVAKEFDATG